jgi:acetyltransferase-like isoleucine patch superfamily enzyme
MPQGIATDNLKRSMKQRFQALVRARFWKMDVHPSAWIAPTALIDRTWPKGIHIGEGCVLDHEVVILTHDRTRGIYLDTTLGARTTVGARAIVMPGVNIGSDCVIEPGAVVLRDVPPGARVAGNPGKIVD